MNQIGPRDKWTILWVARIDGARAGAGVVPTLLGVPQGDLVASIGHIGLTQERYNALMEIATRLKGGSAEYQARASAEARGMTNMDDYHIHAERMRRAMQTSIGGNVADKDVIEQAISYCRVCDDMTTCEADDNHGIARDKKGL